MLAVVLVGCGSDGKGLVAGDDGGSSGDDAPPGGDVGPPPPGFQVKTPVIDLAPGADLTYCYYFRTSNTTDLSIKKWESELTEGVQYVVVYFTASELSPPGTLTTESCDYTTYGQGPRWAYSTSSAQDSLEMPADDGTGQPVGRPVVAEQAAFLQIHLANTTAVTTHESIHITATAYPEGTATTYASSFVTYNTRINVASGNITTPTEDMVTGNCPVPTDKKFFYLTSHTNKQGTRVTIRDGATVKYDDKPASELALAAPYSFTSGKFGYSCEYSNPNNYPLHSGDNATRDEVCRAIGYFYPAADSTGLSCSDSLTTPTN